MPLLPGEFDIVLVNRFGDVICRFNDGSVHYLDTSMGEVRHLADSMDDFSQKFGETENVLDWLMIPLVDRCVAAGKLLSSDRCYFFVQSVILGGKYEVENIATVPLSEYMFYSADLYRQLKDVPDGGQVQIVVTE